LSRNVPKGTLALSSNRLAEALMTRQGRLAGKVALVTGSTHGIGRRTARVFAEEGARVMITGRDAAAGASLVEDITAAGGEAIFAAADLTDAAAVQALVDDAVTAFGTLDIVVNNAAGIDLLRLGGDGPVHALTAEAFSASMSINLEAVIWVLRCALPVMTRGGAGGSIVNVSSLAATTGHPGVDAYTAAKGAVLSLTRSLAVEYAPHGIRTNCVVIGYVPHDDERPTHQPGMAGPEDVFLDVQLTRIGRPEDVARACLFFADECDSGFVTGQTLIVDGGVSARAPIVGKIPKYSQQSS
jgi:3-oxoacyl-[acyl-carrier protein] reductase